MTIYNKFGGINFYENITPDSGSGGGGGGASSFRELKGNPYDNTALSNALNNKANVSDIQDINDDLAQIHLDLNQKADESDIQDINDDLAQIHLDLNQKADISDLNQTNENLAGLTGDVENLAGEVDSKQPIISDIETIRTNAQTGAELAPQVEVNTKRIEELTVSKFPNAIVIGTPRIQGGQVSNFSDSNYMQFPFVDISKGYPFDIYFSFTTGDDLTTQQNILDSYFGIALAIKDSKGIMSLSSNGTGWDIGTSTGTNILLPRTTYYAKFSWTGTEYTTALSTNDEEFVPDMRLNSNLSPNKTTIYVGGSPNLFGASSAHPFRGSVNFNGSRVYLPSLGQNVWEGMADVGFATRANVSLTNLDEVGEARFDAKMNKTGDETHDGKLTNTGVVDISSGVGTGALVLGADVNATTRTANTRKIARINAPTNESNLDIPTTILSFDTQGDSASTIGQTGTGIYNRIEFGGRLGATSVTAPDGIAFTVTKVHNGMQQNQKVYALEMSSTQARFNVQPNYNGASLVTVNNISNMTTTDTTQTITGAKDFTNITKNGDALLPIVSVTEFPSDMKANVLYVKVEE